MSADLPHSLDDARHVDLERRSLEPWMRRLVLVALAGMVTAALLNTFGQTSVVTSAAVPSAELRVRAPEHVRGGLFFQARIEVLARDRIPAPRLLLDEGWSEELQLNTIEPAPVEESSADGRIELAYGPLEAGQRLKVWLQFEANPTGAGRRSQDVELRNGDTTVTSVTRDITVFP